jgi:hypothetical protein
MTTIGSTSQPKLQRCWLLPWLFRRDDRGRLNGVALALQVAGAADLEPGSDLRLSAH